jgi:hypothetical protein
MNHQAPTKDRKKKGTRENPRETVYPEQGGKSSSTTGDAYNGDDKHGPLEEEVVEKQ